MKKFTDLWKEAENKDRLISFMSLENAEELMDSECANCREQIQMGKKLQKQGYKVRAIFSESRHVLGLEIKEVG